MKNVVRQFFILMSAAYSMYKINQLKKLNLFNHLQPPQRQLFVYGLMYLMKMR